MAFSALHSEKLFEWAFSRGLIQNIPIPVFLPKAPEYYPAYIYTDDELKRLFDCALTYRKYRSFVNEPICIRYILMITYMLGLRISETLSLKIKDIDMDNMYVHIHCSKFYKSRLVTFNEQVSKLMQEILQWRSTQMSPMVEDAYVFINQKGKPVNFVSLHQIFATIRKNAGLYFLIEDVISLEYMIFAILLRSTSLLTGINQERTYRIYCRSCLSIWDILTCPSLPSI